MSKYLLHNTELDKVWVGETVQEVITKAFIWTDTVDKRQGHIKFSAATYGYKPIELSYLLKDYPSYDTDQLKQLTSDISQKIRASYYPKLNIYTKG